MAAKKVLFNGIFKNILDFCGIKARALVETDCAYDWCYESTVRSWRTRGIPDRFNLPVLLDALAGVLKENPHMARRLESQHARLLMQLMPVWDSYGVPAAEWRETDSVCANLQNILTAAYEASLGSDLSGEAVQAVAASTAELSAPAQAPSPSPEKAAPSPVKRVVAFDLDGTLIKGFRYSWTLLFRAIGKTEKEAVKYMDDFEFNRISYEAWCESDCRALRAGGTHDGEGPPHRKRIQPVPHRQPHSRHTAAEGEGV